MASTSFSNPSSDLVVDCPICRQEMTFPKLLHCGHSICANCALYPYALLVGPNGGKPTTRRCPVCSEATTIRADVPLTTNHDMKTLIARVEQLRENWSKREGQLINAMETHVHNSTRLLREKEALRLGNIDKEGEIAKLHKLLDEYGAQLAAMTSQLRGVEVAKGQLEARINSMEVQLHVANAEKERLVKELRQRTTKIHELQHQNADFVHRLGQVRHIDAERATLEMEVGSKTSQIYELDQQVTNLVAEFISARQEKDSMRAELDSFKHQLISVEVEKDSMRAELASLKHQLTSSEGVKDSMKAELDSLTHEMTSSENEKDSLMAELTFVTHQLASSEVEKDSMKAELDSLKHQLTPSEGVKDSMKPELDSHKHQLTYSEIRPHSELATRDQIEMVIDDIVTLKRQVNSYLGDNYSAYRFMLDQTVAEKHAQIDECVRRLAASASDPAFPKALLIAQVEKELAVVETIVSDFEKYKREQFAATIDQLKTTRAQL